MPKSKRVTLDFSDAPKKKRTARMRDISAISQCGDELFVASDETTSIECLSRIGKRRFGNYRCFELADFVELKTDPGVESDIEGLSFDGDSLWVVGSHSLKRQKPRDENDPSAAIECLREIERETNRYLLARIPCVRDEDGRYELVQRTGKGQEERTAAQLFGTSKSNMLIDALRDDEHLAPSLAIPAKENGFDIEGLTVIGSHIFLGLRGPVLNGFAIILELHVEDVSPRFFRLLPIGKEGALYRKHFVKLGGLGIRELSHDGDDILILAGPTMDLDGRVLVRRWKNAKKNRKDSLIRAEDLEDVLDVPYTEGAEGREHPEGICVFESGDDRGLLVVYDAPAKERLTAKTIDADLFPLR